MLPDYKDIRDAIPSEPLWFDDHGVPRYQPFHPEMLGVYADCAVLVDISCQDCGQRFLVGEGFSYMDRFERHLIQVGLQGPDAASEPKSVDEFLEDLARTFHYGDPPRHGCVGDTMNCCDLAVVEAWKKESMPRYGWVRRSELEGSLDLPEWYSEKP